MTSDAINATKTANIFRFIVPPGGHTKDLSNNERQQYHIPSRWRGDPAMTNWRDSLKGASRRDADRARQADLRQITRAANDAAIRDCLNGQLRQFKCGKMEKRTS